MLHQIKTQQFYSDLGLYQRVYLNTAKTPKQRKDTQRHAKTGKDMQRRAKVRKDTQRRQKDV